MGGDVTGMSNACVVVALATYPLSLVAPSATGNVLTWGGAQWDDISPAVAFLVPGTPSTSIVSARSVAQSVTAPGLVGVTNLGSDTSGTAGGVTADYGTIIGGDGNEAGEGAAVIGGLNCVAGGYFSLVAGSELSTISSASDQAAVVGGLQNDITGTSKFSAIIGSRNAEIATASRAVIIAGDECYLSHADSASVAGVGAQSRAITQLVRAGGQTEAAGTGNRQWTQLVLRGDTAGAAPGETVNLGMGGAVGAAPTVTALALLDDRAYLVTARATGVRSTGVGRVIHTQAFVRRAGGVVDVVAQHNSAHFGDPSCCAYDIDMIASGGSLLVQASVGAANTHATRWVATVEWEEVRYA